MNKKSKYSGYQGDFKIGFETKTIRLTLDKIIYTRALPENLSSSTKFRKVISSIKEVGVIEPPVVTINKKNGSSFILLDGHLRIEALKRLNINEVNCLISTDDESFTYNKYINRLSPVQEHRMILKAVEKGVSEVDIAKALNLDVASRSLDIYLKAVNGESDITENDNEKLLKIGELAKKVQETNSTIRHWTKHGLLEVSEITASGYQMYSTETIERIKKIKELKDKRLTLDEIKLLLDK